MQLDLIDLINQEEAKVKNAVLEQQIHVEVEVKRAALGWEEYQSIKAEQGLDIDINILHWEQSYSIAPEYTHCDIKVIIPPDALSSLQYYQRFPKNRASYYRDDPVAIACHNTWAAYNHGIWDFTPHGVDWLGAYRLLSKHRDSGEPIWIRLSRVSGRPLGMLVHLVPDCIVEVKGTSI